MLIASLCVAPLLTSLAPARGTFGRTSWLASLAALIAERTVTLVEPWKTLSSRLLLDDRGRRLNVSNLLAGGLLYTLKIRSS